MCKKIVMLLAVVRSNVSGNRRFICSIWEFSEYMELLLLKFLEEVEFQ